MTGQQEEIVLSQEQFEEMFGSDGDEGGGSHIIYGSPNEIRTRSLVVTGPVDENMASAICSKLINFNIEDPDAPVCMYINTYGGSAYDMMAIYDIMQWVKCPIYTVGFGKIMSAGVLLLAAGEAGHRYALPNTTVMIHKVRGGAVGTVEDIESSSKHIVELQKNMEGLLKKHTSIKTAKMKEFMSGADSYLNTKEARALGIIDNVTATTPKVLLE